jgi:Domain of unknown function (DUF4160)
VLAVQRAHLSLSISTESFYTCRNVPILSSFFGITIRMYFNDHNPPHFHVAYQGHEAYLSIEDGAIIEGFLPKKCLALVQEWSAEHRSELQDNWLKATNLEPLFRIPGADQ